MASQRPPLPLEGSMALVQAEPNLEVATAELVPA
jgi:hypothetical protein